MFRHFLAASVTLCLLTPAAIAQSVEYGDDSGPYANDSECDDPRFVGWGVATSTDSSNALADATDCRRLHELGQIRLNRTQSEFDVAQCAKVNFGNDDSDFSNDNECDDPRFTGPNMHSILNFEDLGGDASDCRTACEAGAIWLR